MPFTEADQAEWDAKCVERDKKLAATASDADMRDEFIRLRAECLALGIAMNHSPIVSDLFARGFKIVCGTGIGLNVKHAMMEEVRTFVAEVRSLSPFARQGLHKRKPADPFTQMHAEHARALRIETAKEKMLAAFDVALAAGCRPFVVNGKIPDLDPQIVLWSGVERLPETTRAGLRGTNEAPGLALGLLMTRYAP